MIRSRTETASWDLELIAAAAAIGMGVATILGISAAAAGDVLPALIAGAIFGLALLAIVALGWVQPLPLLVLSLPLPALYSTETVRLPPVLFVAALVVFGWFLGRAHDRRPLIALPGAVTSLVALLCAVILAAAFAAEIVPALRETANFMLFVGLFAVALDAFASSRDRVDTLATWVTLAAACAGIAGVVEMAGFVPARFPLPGTGLYRAAGGFGWPNELAMFLAVASPLVVYRVRVARTAASRTVALGALVALGLGLTATFSRGSWVAVAVSPAVLLLVGEWRFVLRYSVALLIAAVAVDLATGGAVSTRILGTPEDPLVAQRLLLTGAGLLMFQSSPIVGVGPGGFGDALEAFGPQISGLFDFVGSAHNGYVHVAAETGIIGLAAFLYLIVSTWLALLRGARRQRPDPGGDPATEGQERALRVALLWSFTAACLVSVFEWPFAHGVGELIVIVAAAGRALAAGAATDHAGGGREGTAEGRSPAIP